MVRMQRPSRTLARSTPVWVALALAGALLGPATAGEPDPREVAARLQEWLDGTRDLEGEFRQTLRSGALGSGISESGKLYIARPGKMRWDYTDPERKVALLDGDRTTLWIEEDEQVILGRLGADSDLLPRLLVGDGRIDELFEVSAARPGEDGGLYHLRLVPRRASDTLEEVVLWVRPPACSIEGAEVLDSAGNRIEYRFSGLRRNRGIPEQRFRFAPPAGAEVLGEH